VTNQARVLRRRRRQDIVAGWRCRAARRPGLGDLQTSITEQGQGSESLTAQIVQRTRVSMDRARPRHPGRYRQHAVWRGTWAVAGAGIGGEAALQPRKRCARTILDVAAAILQSKAGETPGYRHDSVVNAGDGASRIELTESRQDRLFPPRYACRRHSAELMATRHFVRAISPSPFNQRRSGLVAEVDVDTGLRQAPEALGGRGLRHHHQSAVGPNEQIRAGWCRAFGAALFEKCIYDERGQLTNANMADYLVRMSGEMPDIECRPRSVADAGNGAGAKGAGRSRDGRGGGRVPASMTRSGRSAR